MLFCVLCVCVCVCECVRACVCVCVCARVWMCTALLPPDSYRIAFNIYIITYHVTSYRTNNQRRNKHMQVFMQKFLLISSDFNWTFSTYFSKCLTIFRLKKSNKTQLYADIYLPLNYSKCFGRPSRRSSGVHKTVLIWSRLMKLAPQIVRSVPEAATTVLYTPDDWRDGLPKHVD